MQVVVAKNFASNLSAALKAKGMSQRELAAGIGMSYTFLNQIIKGHSVPSLDTCERISVALGIPLGDMLDDPKRFERSLRAIA